MLVASTLTDPFGEPLQQVQAVATGADGAEKGVVGNPLRTAGPDDAAPAGWDGSARATDGYSSAVIAVETMGGAVSIAVKSAILGGAATPLDLFDMGGATTGRVGAQANIAGPGKYQVAAAGALSFVAAGPAGFVAPTVTLVLKR